jgi:hypothetical protein
MEVTIQRKADPRMGKRFSPLRKDVRLEVERIRGGGHPRWMKAELDISRELMRKRCRCRRCRGKGCRRSR